MSPSPSAAPTVVRAAVFPLRVVKPSGAQIADAKIEIEWEDVQNPYHETPTVQQFQTDANGSAAILILDPKEWWLPGPGPVATVRFSKAFHGPVVPYGTPFKYAAASIRVRVTPGATLLLTILDEAENDLVLWGRPRVVGDAGDVLEITLVEGGELGREHAGTRTRRLSAPHRPDDPATTISQIDEELLFHIAHGGLAPTLSTDYKFEVVTATSGEQELRLKLPAVATATPPVVPRISARNSVAGGLRFVNLWKFGEKASILLSGPAGMNNLNPRLMVGVIRLARRLLATDGKVRTVLSSGFGRAADDSHGQGRAIDFGGVSLAHVPGLSDPDTTRITDAADPHCTKKSGADWKTDAKSGVVFLEKTCVSEIDFVVFYHWGSVQLHVDTGAGKVRRNEDGKPYRNDFEPATSGRDRLLYRLAELPPVSARSANHVMTDRHYELARDLFAATYGFFTQEFSHRETFLGPVKSRISPLAKSVETQALADDAAGAPVPGTVKGFVLHPDYPTPDGGGPQRQAHANHVHANLGGVKPGQTDFER